ncbi:MAG: hypothetical protein CL946_00655 [Ectothiorhodospiraceae bacterium]|nr:hypothetical protein [Ectothiorhodospiraceae bacterium]
MTLRHLLYLCVAIVLLGSAAEGQVTVDIKPLPIATQRYGFLEFDVSLTNTTDDTVWTRFNHILPPRGAYTVHSNSSGEKIPYCIITGLTYVPKTPIPPKTSVVDHVNLGDMGKSIYGHIQAALLPDIYTLRISYIIDDGTMKGTRIEGECTFEVQNSTSTEDELMRRSVDYYWTKLKGTSIPRSEFLDYMDSAIVSGEVSDAVLIRTFALVAHDIDPNINLKYSNIIDRMLSATYSFQWRRTLSDFFSRQHGGLIDFLDYTEQALEDGTVKEENRTRLQGYIERARARIDIQETE